MALLATTALECTWGDAEPLIFLGEWCRRYERSAVWKAREHTVVRYHWDDREKLRRDHAYLKRLHKQILAELAGRLGEMHGLERSGRYWQILLDPWLSRYLAVAFDRWEAVRIACNEYGVSQAIAIETIRSPAVRDHLEFLDAVCGDEWNHDLCGDILEFEYSDRCRVRRCSVSGVPGGVVQGSGTARRRRDWKSQVASRVDRAIGYLARKNDLVFVHSYFPLGAFVRLNLRLKQLPAFYLSEFGSPNYGANAWQVTENLRRDDLRLQGEPLDRFQSFLARRIAIDIPQVFVELFAAVGRHAISIKIRPKAILTANDHANNDLFKRWAAQKVHEGIPFVVLEHGSGIPPQFSAMGFEEDVADVKTTWTTPHQPRQIRLPSNKLAGRRRGPVTGRRLIVVGQEMPRYAFDAHTMPIAGQTLVGFEYVCRLYDGLEEEARRDFLVKPYPNLGWCTRERFVERLGASKVSNESNLDRLMKTARMVICTYPQTTFSEAMASGAPALLVYAKHLWETVPQFDGLLDALRAARIVFTDPAAAAAHVNGIWSDPMAWWQSRDVRLARARYEAEALDLRRDWIRPWTQFARSLLARGGARAGTGAALRRP
jgi:putative transferase (TIGR04331 family)